MQNIFFVLVQFLFYYKFNLFFNILWAYNNEIKTLMDGIVGQSSKIFTRIIKNKKMEYNCKNDVRRI